MKTQLIYLTCLLVAPLFFRCEDRTATDDKKDDEKIEKRDTTFINVAGFESIDLDEVLGDRRNRSGLDRNQDRVNMTYSWLKNPKVDAYLFELFKNGEEFKSMRTTDPKVSIKMSEFRGMRRGDTLEARVSNIYKDGTPIFTRSYRVRSDASGGRSMSETESPNLNPKKISYEWESVEGAENYHFTLRIQPVGSEDIATVMDTIVAKSKIIFTLDHLNKGDQITAEVQAQKAGQALGVSTATTALYANGVARSDIILLAKKGSTITRDSILAMCSDACGRLCRSIAFEEGNYYTEHGEIELKGKQYSIQRYNTEDLLNCLDTTNIFLDCLKKLPTALPDVMTHTCVHTPTE